VKDVTLRHRVMKFALSLPVPIMMRTATKAKRNRINLRWVEN